MISVPLVVLLLAASGLQERLESYAADRSAVPTGEVHVESAAAAAAYIMGRDLAASERHEEAIAAFRRAAMLDDSAAAPLAGMAISLAGVGRRDAAMNAWREVLERDPWHADALLLVGLDEAAAENFASAAKHLAANRLLDGQKPVDSLMRDAALVAALRRLGDEATADLLAAELPAARAKTVQDLGMSAPLPAWRAVLQSLVSVFGADVAASLAAEGTDVTRGAVRSGLLTALPVLECAAGGDGSLTAVTFAHAAQQNTLSLMPQWFQETTLADGLSVAAQSMGMLGCDDAAILLYEESLQLDPSQGLVSNNLAWLLLQRDGPTDRAEKLAMFAFDQDPQAAHVLDTLGWLRFKQGRAEESLALLVEAAGQAAEPSPEIFDHLGDAFLAVGDTASARSAWSKAKYILDNPAHRTAAIEGIQSLAHSIWGMSVVTPEAVYDLEFGDVQRRVDEKLASIWTQGKETH